MLVWKPSAESQLDSPTSTVGCSAYDVGWLPLCDDLVVLMPPGWEESEGVWIEIEAAGTLGIRIYYLEVPERFIGLTPARVMASRLVHAAAERSEVDDRRDIQLGNILR